MNDSKLVVDTNIFFSLLLRGDTASRRRFLTDTTRTFHCPRFFLVELFKHKERIAQATELSEAESDGAAWWLDMAFTQRVEVPASPTLCALSGNPSSFAPASLR